MAHQYADLVRETSTTTGTGVFTLSALAGFRRFSDVCSVSDTVYYVIRMNNDYEVGLGTYSASNQLTRTTVIATLVSGVTGSSAVNWGAGTKDVQLTVSGSKLADLDKRRHKATFTSSTGGTVTAATHGLGASPDLTVTAYRDDGTTNTRVWVNIVVGDNGDVTWSASEAFTGFLVIQR